MHDNRLCCLLRRVHDVYLCRRLVTRIDIIERDGLPVGRQFAQHIVILAGIVDDLVDNDSFEGEPQRFLILVGIEGYLLEEMPQLTGVIGGRHRQFAALTDGVFGIFYGGASAAAVGLDNRNILV